MPHSRRTRRLLALALAPLLSAAVTVGAAGPAAAGTERHTDADHDVVTHHDETGEVTRIRRDGVRDLLWIRSEYGAGRLVVTLKLRELTATTYVNLRWRISSAAGVSNVSWNREDGMFGDYANRVRVPCSGPSVEARPAVDKVVLKVPARCLATVPFLRIGATADVPLDADRTRIDDAYRRAGVSRSLAPTLGPRVHYN